MNRNRSAPLLSRPPPSPQRGGNDAAVPLPLGPPRRRSSLSGGAKRAPQPSGRYHPDIPIVESDEGSISSEQPVVMLPPPPRVIPRRASQAALQREVDVDAAPPPRGQPAPVVNGARPQQQPQQQQRSGEAWEPYMSHYSFPHEEQHGGQRGAVAHQPMASSNRVSSSPPRTNDPPLPAAVTKPAPAPQLQPPTQPSSIGQQINPLRNPHAKVSGVEMHAPLPRLQATTEHAADRTRDAVYQFMEQLCPERAAAVQRVMDQFSGRETLLMEAITSIFGDEWAMHQRHAQSSMALQAAEEDAKAFMPVAFRHSPQAVHTTEDILDDGSPTNHRLLMDAPRSASGGSGAGKQMIGSAGTPPLATGLPPTSTTSRSRDALEHPSYAANQVAQHAHPVGINNSRPQTPSSGPFYAISGQQQPSSGSLPRNPPPSSSSTQQQQQPVVAASRALSLRSPSDPSQHAASAAMDPVSQVMATPSSGGILTPPLPAELIFHPTSLSSHPWR